MTATLEVVSARLHDHHAVVNMGQQITIAICPNKDDARFICDAFNNRAVLAEFIKDASELLAYAVSDYDEVATLRARAKTLLGKL